ERPRLAAPRGEGPGGREQEGRDAGPDDDLVEVHGGGMPDPGREDVPLDGAGVVAEDTAERARRRQADGGRRTDAVCGGEQPVAKEGAPQVTLVGDDGNRQS